MFVVITRIFVQQNNVMACAIKTLTNCIQTVGHHVDVRTRGQWADALYGGAVLWSQHIQIARRQLLGL